MSRIKLSSFVRMNNLTFLIKLFFLFCSCFIANVQALQDNPFLTKDFANLFTTQSPTTSTTTQSPTTTAFPPAFNLPFQFTAPSSTSPSSPSSSSQPGSGINWNYPSIFKYQSTNDKRQETSSNNYNAPKRPAVNYGKAPIELYTMMSMKKGRYFPPPEDYDGYSGLVPKSGSNVIGPNGLMEPSMGSGFAAMQGMDASSSTGYDMGYSNQNVGYPTQNLGMPNMGMGYAPTQGFGFGGLGMAQQATSPFGSAATPMMGSPYGSVAAPMMGSPYGSAATPMMGSPYGVPSPVGMSPMAMQYANPPSYLGYPNIQPAASSMYSAYSGYGGAAPYTPAPAYPGFGYGIGGYGSGMYPMSSGLLGAASQTMGSILSPFAALAQPRYPYFSPFG